METKQIRLICDLARQKDIVDFLSQIGYLPVKVSRQDYWYLSPFREENTASFKVNRGINRWYDHGMGKGGSAIDFVILFYQCSIHVALIKLTTGICNLIPKRSTSKIAYLPAIQIVRTQTIQTPALLCYLKTRRIPPVVAAAFCKEVHYNLSNKTYYSIGFENDLGGYELRNTYAKNSSSPKSITTLKKGANKIAVFEGFFDFLSFQTILPTLCLNELDFCILNSLALFEKARHELERYSSIHLYLDNDLAGENCKEKATSLNSKYKDESQLYKGYKDLNDWLVNMGRSNKQISLKRKNQ